MRLGQLRRFGKVRRVGLSGVEGLYLVLEEVHSGGMEGNLGR